jgi:hypothetical protein
MTSSITFCIEYQDVECRFAEYHDLCIFMLSVITLRVVILSVLMLNVVMLKAN